MADSKVTIVLNAEGSEAVAAVFADLAAKGKDFANGLTGGSKDASNALKDLGSTAKVVFEIFTGVSLSKIFTDALVAIKAFSTEASKLALHTQVQGNAFRALAESVGVSGDVLGKQIESVSGGLISMSDAYKTASRALMEGLQPEQILKLAESARQLAKVMGVDATEAFNTLTTAIVSGQTRQLKTIGVYIESQQALDQYAGSLGRTGQELNEFGRVQALTDAVITKSAESVKTLTAVNNTQSETLQLLKNAWSDFQTSVGDAINTAGFAALDWAKQMYASIPPISGELAKLGPLFSAVGQSAMNAFGPLVPILINILIPAIKILALGVSAMSVGLTAAFTTVAGPIAYVASLIADMANKRWPDFTKATAAADVATFKARASMYQAIGAFGDLAKQSDTAGEATKTFGATAEAGAAQVAKLNKQFQDPSPRQVFVTQLEAATAAVKAAAVAQQNAIEEAVAQRTISEEAGAAQRVAAEAAATAKLVQVYQNALANFKGSADERLALQKQLNEALLADDTARSKQRIELANQETAKLKTEYEIRLAQYKNLLGQQLALTQQAETARAAISKSNESARLAQVDRETSAELSALKIKTDLGLVTEKAAIQKRLDLETDAADRRYRIQKEAAGREMAIAQQAADQRLNSVGANVDRQRAALDEQFKQNLISENDYNKQRQALDDQLTQAILDHNQTVLNAQIDTAQKTQDAWQTAERSIQDSAQAAAEATAASLNKIKTAGSSLVQQMKDNAGQVISIQRATGPGAGFINNPLARFSSPEAIERQVQGAKDLAAAQTAWFNAMQTGQISFAQWQAGANLGAKQLTDTLAKLPQILDEAAAKEVLLASAAEVAKAAMEAQSRAVAAQKAAAVTPEEILAAAQAEADLAVRQAQAAADELVTQRAITQAKLEGAAASKYAADTATLVSYTIQKGAEEAAAALVAGAKAAIAAYESVRNAALKLNTQLVGDLVKLQTDAAVAIKDQLTNLDKNVAFAQTQLNLAIAAKASAAEQITLEQNLRDAIIARYDTEKALIEQIEQQIKDQLSGAATPLIELQTTIATLALTATGNVAPFKALNTQLMTVAETTTNATIKLWALSQGIAAVVASAQAAVQAAVRGQGPLAITPTATGPGIDVTQVQPFVQGLYDAAAPIIAKLGTLAQEAINKGDIQGAISLLQQEQAGVQALAQAAIKAVNDWATAAVEAVNTFAEKQIASVTAAAKTQTDPLEAQIKANDQIIKATEAQAKAAIDANNIRIKGLNAEIDAIQKVATAQEKANQRQIDGLNKQITAIQRAADAQIKINEKQADTLSKQIDAINKIADAQRDANQKQLDVLDVQKDAVQTAIDAAQDWQRALDSVQKQIQDLLLGPEAPLNPMAQLQIARDAYKKALEGATTPAGVAKAQGAAEDLIKAARDVFKPSTSQLEIARQAYERSIVGATTPEGITNAQRAADTFLKTAGTLFARPSTEYQKIFSEVMGTLTHLEGTATAGRGPASLDDLNAQLATLNAQIKSLNDTNKRIEADAKERTAPLKEQVDALKALNDTITAQTDEQLEPLRASVDTLTEANDNLKAATDALVQPLKDDVDALTTLNTTIQGQADAITGPLETLNTNLQAQIDGINAARDRQIDDINTATRDQIGIINSVRDSQIDAINSGLGTTLSNIESTLSPLVTQLIGASTAAEAAATGGDTAQGALTTATTAATTALTTLNQSILALIGAMQAPPGTPAQPPPQTTTPAGFVPYPPPPAPSTPTAAPAAAPMTPAPIFNVPTPAHPSTTPATGGTITPGTFTPSPTIPFPRFQQGGIMPFKGFAHLEEKEMVLPERIATYVIQAMARPTPAREASSLQLSIAPGAITISGVSDPEKAAALALDMVEESVRTGRLNTIVREKLQLTR